MRTSINWNEPINWAIGGILLLVLVGQVWLINRNSSLSTISKWLKVGLNFLLWLVVVGYFLQFRWQSAQSANHALLVSNDVPADFVRRVKDSLRIQDSFTARNFKADYDSITLIGQEFPTASLTRLSNAAVHWIPYDGVDQVQDIHWKGIVRQGEMQRVTGQLRSSKKQTLAIRYGTRTIDSVALKEGANRFALEFPAFTRGRTQTALTLGDVTLDTVRFYSRPTEPLTVLFLLNSPDFESKTLANWLGKQGHTVQLSTTLSKNITSDVRINKVDKATNKVPDLIITEPDNAANVTVRKALADGRSVLFINVVNPEVDCRTINQAVGSRWQVRKVSNEPTIPLGNGLNALPYRFSDAVNQFPVTGYPIAVQRTTGRVGVSLLSETFPLSLSGDSVTYNRIWTATLTRLSNSDKNNALVDAPIYSGLPEPVSVNNLTSRPAKVRVGQDTLQLSYSPINQRTASATFISRRSGWLPVQDSLAVYVEGRSDGQVSDRRMVEQFVRAHSAYQTASLDNARQINEQLPNWAWFILFIVCLTALWLEPKLS
ncbi:hypothetical protein ACFSUS_02165 [Spirosoma soli]|uniref:Aerotolerance regulator N-terminal domain-containing protein n=1 Tax=Spirosoma soli TaxID=1770529 RepID=A0ABW5LYS9_9BACT